MPRGRTKYNEMKLVINELLHEIGKKPQLKEDYEKVNKNLVELDRIFQQVKHIYQNTNSRMVSFSRLSWETFVRTARDLKHDRDRPGSPKRYSTTYVAEEQKKKRGRGRPRKNSSTATKRSKSQTTAENQATTAENQAPQRRLRPTLAPRTNVASRARRTSANCASRASRRTRNTSETNTSGKRNRVLTRNHCGQFDFVSCLYCKGRTTTHRCMINKCGGLIDNGREICGKPFCLTCAGEWGFEIGVTSICDEHANVQLYNV